VSALALARLRRGQAGQHLSEFALVLGLAATVAVSMQYLVRRSIATGARNASDAILELPVARGGCPDTDGDGLCDCEDANRDNDCDGFASNATQKATETGTGYGARTTAVAESADGQAESEHIFERLIRDLRPPPVPPDRPRRDRRPPPQ